MPLSSPLVLVALGLVSAERTALTLDPPAPASPRYSQSISITAHLQKSDGTTGVAGTDCSDLGSPPCAVVVTIAPADDPDAVVIVNVQGFVTDSNGDTSGAHIIFVDGVPDQNARWVADPDGTDYVVTARFLGAGTGQVPTNPDCDAANPEGAANGLCPSEASTTLKLFAEQSAIALGQGLEASLGDTITLSAEVTDPNGNSDGTDVDGPGPVDLSGVDVKFFYDVDGDGNAALDELVGTAPTNAAGVAAVELALDPTLKDATGLPFFHAGTFENGVQAEYSGDDHFSVARASARIVVHPAGLDVAKTVIEADPGEIPADGFSKSNLRVRLVDSFNNPLDENSDEHTVELTTDLGLLSAVERDLLDGTYTATLQAQRKGGTATVKVKVDGVDGPSRTVEITGGDGCHCGSTDGAALASTTLGALALLALRRRRRYIAPDA